MMSRCHVTMAAAFWRGRKAFSAPLIAGALSALTSLPSQALAHEFTAALLVVGENRETRLADAVRGFLLAADERDGHAGETSDGHLGGVDVHILPRPPEAAGRVTGLSGAPVDPPDVTVVLADAGPSATASAADPEASVVITPGDLPAGWDQINGADGFAMRYLQAHGETPSKAAALGYQAARRLDAAIRPLDGVTPRADLEAALRATQSGFQW